MRWLIDGYNVVRRDPELQAREAESLEAGRRAVPPLLARAPRAPRAGVPAVLRGGRADGGRAHPRGLLTPASHGGRRAPAARASARKRRRGRELGPEDPGLGPPGRECRSDRRAISGSPGGSTNLLGR